MAQAQIIVFPIEDAGEQSYEHGLNKPLSELMVQVKEASGQVTVFPNEISPDLNDPMNKILVRPGGIFSIVFQDVDLTEGGKVIVIG